MADVKRYWYLFAIGTLVFALAIAWWFLRYKTPRLPPLDIPGLEKVEQVESDYGHIKAIATVKYLGVTYDCSFTVNIDANGELILPTKDQALTPIVSEDESLEIWKDQIKLGALPIVLAVNRESDNIYLVGPRGGSLKPMVVKPGMVNLAIFDQDTVIRGQEGVRVKVLRAGREVDDAKLPLATRLGNDPGVVEVQDVQVFGIGGVGIFNIYTGKTEIKRGNNNILPVGRFVGNHTWFDKGVYLGSSDVGYCANGDTINILSSDRKEVVLKDLDPKMVEGNGCLPDGSLVALAGGKLVNVHKDGTTSDIDFQSASPVSVSGGLIVSGKTLYDVAQGKAFDAGVDFDYIAFGVAIQNSSGKLQAYRLAPEGPQTIWTKASHLAKNAKLVVVRQGIVFFDMGDRCTEYLDVRTGASGRALSALGKKDQLDIIEGDGLCFPNGSRIKQGVVCVTEDGKLLWGRTGEKPKRIGAYGVAVEDRTGRKTTYDISTGEEVTSWIWTNMNIASLDEAYFTLIVNGNHTIFVQRLIRPYK